MSLIYAIRLFVDPRAAWAALHERRYGALQVFLSHTVPFAVLPVAAGFLWWSTSDLRLGAARNGRGLHLALGLVVLVALGLGIRGILRGIGIL